LKSLINHLSPSIPHRHKLNQKLTPKRSEKANALFAGIGGGKKDSSDDSDSDKKKKKKDKKKSKKDVEEIKQSEESLLTLDGGSSNTVELMDFKSTASPANLLDDIFSGS
jgi:hypothetical protein